jgi:hypothetical protein
MMKEAVALSASASFFVVRCNPFCLQKDFRPEIILIRASLYKTHRYLKWIAYAHAAPNVAYISTC